MILKIKRVKESDPGFGVEFHKNSPTEIKTYKNFQVRNDWILTRFYD